MFDWPVCTAVKKISGSSQCRRNAISSSVMMSAFEPRPSRLFSQLRNDVTLVFVMSVVHLQNDVPGTFPSSMVGQYHHRICLNVTPCHWWFASDGIVEPRIALTGAGAYTLSSCQRYTADSKDCRRNRRLTRTNSWTDWEIIANDLLTERPLFLGRVREKPFELVGGIL